MRIALSQIVADPDPGANLTTIKSAVEEAAAQQADLVVFPEATMACFGIPLGPVAEPLDGPWATAVRAIARQHGITVVTGMFTPAPDGRVTNTLLITGPNVETHYDKIHLFDAFGFAESATVAPGEQPVTFDLDGVTLGVATCYDVRFPELFRRLADDGAQAILLPASWGAGPGKVEQWEVLVRARALDSTTWLLACGQADPLTVGREPSGKAPTGVGHSMAVSPLGEIHGRLGAEPGLLVADIDLDDALKTARSTIPVLANRRFANVFLDDAEWRPLTQVEGKDLFGGQGRMRTRLATEKGVLLEIEYPAGVRSPEHSHAHDSFIHLLSGHLRGTIAGEPGELRPGETLLHPQGTPHTVEAVTDSRWLEFKTPPAVNLR